MGEEFPGQKPSIPEKPEQKPESESKGTPVDMTPDPNFPLLHQSEKLTREDMLDMLKSLGKRGEDEEKPPPSPSKDTIEGK